jgi:hypothetical protein
MPRKSAASLSVVAPKPPPYPAAPGDFTPSQAKIWDTIVRCRPPEYFDGACRDLLEAYCRHCDAADVIARAIQKTDPEDLRRYSKLLEMGARESKAIMALSAKLRLAPQHVRRVEQVLPRQAHRRPWEWVS